MISLRFFTAAILLTLCSSVGFSQNKTHVKYYIELDSIGVPDESVPYEALQNCRKFGVHGISRYGDRYDCKVVSGKIFIAGIVGNYEIDDKGVSYWQSYKDEDKRKYDANPFVQSKNRAVSINITFVDEEGEQRHVGCSFKVTP